MCSPWTSLLRELQTAQSVVVLVVVILCKVRGKRAGQVSARVSAEGFDAALIWKTPCLSLFTTPASSCSVHVLVGAVIVPTVKKKWDLLWLMDRR